MKFIISKKVIETAVDFLYTYVDLGDVNHSGKNIGLEIDSSSLKFIVNTNSFTAKKEFEVDEADIKLETSGRIILNATILKNVIKKFDRYITFETLNETILIYEGLTKFELATYQDPNFFIVDFNDSYNKFEVNSKDMDRIVNDVCVSTSLASDKLNSIMYKCVHLKGEEKGIRFSATDSYRMSTEVLKTLLPINIDVVIEAKALKKIITKETPKKIFVFFNTSKLGISYENTIIQVNLTSIKYIDTTRLFDFGIKNVIKIDKTELNNLINKALFINSEKSRRLEFNFSQAGINLNFEVPEIGSAKAHTVNYELEGPDFEIDLDYLYLKDAISTLENGKIIIRISDKYDRLLFTAENDTNNKQLITPLRRY
ncbi:DNA polymerase III subunit beta [Mycoplasma buteonis]|uniref:DNA polymerase III subunit beta n=1 Tax=Mycoplasma buteonis TaxID=171280 RepID=UPI00055F53FC|nr:DNA polymerase III subunit beta [Mycoplasma buteonis]